MNRVEVKPELLKWARERSSYSILDMESHFPKYPLWEKGEELPTFHQLENFAKKTLTPIGYLFLDQPPEEKLPIPDFRTIQDAPPATPSPNLLETVQTMQRRQEWMREFLIDEGEVKLPFIGSYNLNSDPVEIAKDILSVLKKSPNWAEKYSTWEDALRNLRSAIEDAGIMVVVNGIVGNNTYRKLETEEFRGFVLVDEYAPLIFVNGSDTKGAQMFTIAHELAHLWVGLPGVFNMDNMLPANNKTEKFCNHIAAEFLIPESELKICWPKFKNTEEPFQGLAKKFKVSAIVAARRALDLGLIGKQSFLGFYNKYHEDLRKNKINAPSRGNFYATQNSRIGVYFAQTVIRAAKEGKLLYRDAYNLTGIYGKTFDEYTKKIVNYSFA